jgi:hypothetical protein
MFPGYTWLKIQTSNYHFCARCTQFNQKRCIFLSSTKSAPDPLSWCSQTALACVWFHKLRMLRWPTSCLPVHFVSFLTRCFISSGVYFTSEYKWTTSGTHYFRSPLLDESDSGICSLCCSLSTCLKTVEGRGFVTVLVNWTPCRMFKKGL